ncbi:MAG: hypothetical protein QOK06_979 [Acidimicrobiaceae bacterium]|jgi:polyisoprenoid-binding protein YceI
MAMTEDVRIIGDRLAPLPGRWVIDATHSQLEFEARHLMIAKARGRFSDFSGTITIGDAPERSSVEALINAASIDTGDPQRDAHLRSPDFLDVETYPVIRYQSTAVRPGRGEHWEVDGELTVRDMVRPFMLDVEFGGSVRDPWGKLRSSFFASAEIDREEFGVTWNQALETGGFLLGKTVKVQVNVEAVRDSD